MKFRYLSIAAAGLLVLSWQPVFAQDYPEDTDDIYEPGDETPGYGEPGDTDVDVDVQPGEEQPGAFEPRPEGTMEPEAEVEADREPFAVRERRRTGLGIAAGGGVMDFVGSDLRGVTDTGGKWDARLVFGTRSPVAVEAAYIGSAQNIDTLGVEDSAILLSNGASAALRVNILKDLPVQPYVSAGAGWRRFSVTNTDTNTSDLNDTDDIFEVPVAAGVAYRMGGFIADVRFAYRAAFADDLLRNAAVDPGDIGAGLDNWDASLTLGVEF